jgi:membrane protease YdiL (CAAX protease family)
MKKLLGENLKLDWKITVLVVVSTLLILLDFYNLKIFPWEKWFPGWMKTGISFRMFDRICLYFIVPMFIILLIFRQNPDEFGFSFGDWKAGILLTIIAIALITPLIWLVGNGNIAMQEFYRSRMVGIPWNTFLDLFGWEFLFRGWLLFGFARKFGSEAIWIQAVPFALAHVGKPEIEALSTIFGGFAFGWVAWRTRSFVYPFLIHWFVGTFIILVSAGILG